MNISIITVCFNSETTIEDTIKSVVEQKNVAVEHVIIDGGSNDGTLDILNKSKSISKIFSEKDDGIYDAMNKGIAIATGDIIGTLNADDFYINNQVLKSVANVFLDPSVEACYSDLIYVRQDDVDKVVRFWKSSDYKVGLFKDGWMPPHPTFFVRRSVYKRFGGFDLNYKLAADFELLFRFIEQNKIKTRYLAKVLVKMRLGGASNKNISNVIKQNKEIISILSGHYVHFSILRFLIRKILNRSAQFYYGYKFKFLGK